MKISKSNLRNWFFPKLRMIPYDFSKWPKLQGHRGAWKNSRLQENSTESLREAKKLGFRMVEFDVRMTKDRQVVLCHDRDLRRIAQSDLVVSESTYQELEKWTELPRLSDLLRDSKTPEYFNIEIKSEFFSDQGIERRIAEMLKHSPTEKRILFSSFDPLCLWKLSHHLPTIPRAKLFFEGSEKDLPFWVDSLALMSVLDVHMVNLESRFFESVHTSKWNPQRLPVSLWTVNDPEQIADYLRLGVQSVITDCDSGDLVNALDH
jgi:glycerophosphoryl diester phosphodiesterase